ncbi:hypothetical protein [Streptomyces sp. NPDC087437]|uniref:hypothetical protein n=1 Tax=Streptomyces sp. NPDC087437 TaxID=3365789 RepID=UPI0038278A94
MRNLAAARPPVQHSVLASVGGAARARIAGGTDPQSGLVGFGRAAELLSRERAAHR